MNRKLRVLMLSLFVVMFSAVSAFAYFTSDDIASFVVADEDNFTPAETGGYNYVNKVMVDLEAWRDMEDETVRPVSWTISPDYDWLEATIGSYDVMLRGILPDENRTYIVHVIAELDGKVLVSEDDDGNQKFADRHIAADVNMDAEAGTGGLEIAVEKDETTVGIFTDLVSVDKGTINTVDDKYSVQIDFPMTWSLDDDPTDDSDEPRKISTDLFPNAQLECAMEGGRYVVESDVLNLPQWLDYKVLSTQHGRALNYNDEKGTVTYPDDYPEDETTYVASLRIFFTSKDYQPKDGEKAVVRVATEVSDIFTDEDSSYYQKAYEDGATIGWEVTYQGTPKIAIRPETASLTVERGESAEASFDYSVVAVSGNPTFSPDVTGVTFTPRVVSVSGDTPSGKIVVSVLATDAAQLGSHDVTMTVTGVNGKTATATINVTVTAVPVIDPIEVSPKTASLSVEQGKTASTEFTYTKAEFASAAFSQAPAGVTLSAAASDGKITVTAEATATATAGGPTAVTMTVTDANGKTDTATINVTVTVPDVPVPPGPVVPSGDITISIIPGGNDPNNAVFPFGAEAVTYKFVIGNTTSEGVTWEILGDDAALALINSTSGSTNEVSFTINTNGAAPGNYSATLQARDSSGRDAGTYTFNWTVQEPDVPPTPAGIKLSSIDVAVSVDFGASVDLKVGYTNQAPVKISFEPDISKDVKLTLSGEDNPIDGIPNGVITITAEPLTRVAKLYSTDIIVTDANGATDSLTLFIDVNYAYTPVLPPVIEISPDEETIFVTVGLSRDVSFTAAKYSGDVTWTLGTVPEGITVVPATDVDSGTEHNTVMVYTVTGVEAGTYSVDIMASDDTGVRHATLNVNVMGVPPLTPVIKISPESASVSVKVGASTNASFTAAEYSGDVTWTLGTVPPGITVAPTAAQTGTTANYTVTGVEAGTYSVDVMASDDTGVRHATLYATVTSSDEPVPGEFTITPSTTTVSIDLGSTVSVTFRVSGASGDVTWSADGLPDGVTINESTGAISGTPTEVGTSSVTVTATDEAGNTKTATISITVNRRPTPSLSVSKSPSSLSVEVGEEDSVTFTATNNNGTVTWTLGSVPSGISVTPTASQTGTRVTYTVKGVTVGSYSLAVTAKDTASSVNATVSVRVTNPGDDGEHGLEPLTIDVTSETTQSRVRQLLATKLGSLITGTTRVVALPSSAMSGNVSYTGSETVNLPAIVVDAAGINVFRVYLENLVVGHTLSWTPNVSDASTGEYIEASDEENNAVFFGDDGQEIKTVPEDQYVNVAAYFEPGKVYEPAITASEARGVGTSSGGCDAGLGAIVSAIAAAFFISKKRS